MLFGVLSGGSIIDPEPPPPPPLHAVSMSENTAMSAT